MNFQVVSDMHIDINEGNPSVFPNTVAPLLLMCGDFCEANHPNYEVWLRALASRFTMIMYVPGNHEFYGNDEPLTRTDEKIATLCESIGNIVNMDGLCVDINNYAFMGCTLWTDMKGISKQNNFMNDFSQIEGGQFSVNEAKIIHRKQRHWLKKKIKDCKDEDYLGAVVFTHHAPDVRLMSLETTDHSVSWPFYYSTDMKDLTEDPFIKIWAHGHTHQVYSARLSEKPGPLFLSNAVGYPDENTGFLTNQMISLGKRPQL